MLFGRTKSLVGLDIGSSSVKAVELKDLGKGRGFQLLNIGIEPLSPEAIVDGAIMDSGLVAETRRAQSPSENPSSLASVVLISRWFSGRRSSSQ